MRIVKDNWREGFSFTLPRNWAGEYVSGRTNDMKHFERYGEIIDWITSNINDPYKNVNWIELGNYFRFQFRKKHDYTLFLLRWS